MNNTAGFHSVFHSESKNRKSKIIILFLLLFLLASCTARPSRKKETAKNLPVYRIGYMICNSRQETLDRFLPLSAYLGKKLGVRFKTEAINTIDFTRRVKDLDFTHTNSLLYIMLHRFNGVDVLAGEKKDSEGYLSQGVIVVRKNSSIKTIADLKGKSMIFGPMLAPTGFMSQVDLLQQHGLNPDKDLSFYTIPPGAYKHEKVAYGVLFGKYDAGSLPLADLKKMIKDGRLQPDDLRIIAKAKPIPYCSFGVTQKISDKFAARFKKALLSITPEDTVEFDGERVKVLKHAWVDGYADINNAAFNPVREMAKRTNMPPYQKY